MPTLKMSRARQSQIGLSGLTSIHWKENSLKATLAEYFNPQQALSVDNSRLGKLFTARNLSRISGIKIIWTTNLADHLRLIGDDQSVFIFHCTSFAQFQDGNKKTKSWLQAQQKSTNIDPNIGRFSALRAYKRRFDRFLFWYNRLWFDKRNGVQWSTFWVAVLVLVITIMFGVIQSVTSILQVYLSYKALEQK
ncbi:hypothetical protein K469DRAFT_723301 [Zopfia rhizophila CBS 207.26]|uniref:Uncharacterized protein n=1 Tax=Zopfia rhizophila CBS 207.26 TaxID=1314779 RepID=A0A6A6DD02_9PEZI|nr:hypothetical protein K469DRAFT_723301 [Zopfia rhizophila CBS 207.26]